MFYCCDTISGMKNAKHRSPTSTKQEDHATFRLSGYDYRNLDKAASDIVSTVLGGGAKVSGPFALPTVSRKLCLNRSPHVYGKAKDHFYQPTHRRLIRVIGFSNVSSDLSRLRLPPGVYVENVRKSM